jgi:hypothetical protein
MDLLKPIKVAAKVVRNTVNKVKDAIKEAEKDVDQQNDLHKWREKLHVAQANYPLDLMNEREYLYLGSRGVDANINSKALPAKYANNVYNICFEFVETMADPTIPQPSVRSKRPEYSALASMIEDSIANDLSELRIERINDMNERITPVQGISIVEVAWNPDFKHQLYRGEIELIHRHPKQLVPQPGIYQLQKMDYFFILESMTKDQIKKDTGKDVSTSEEEYPENTSLYLNTTQNQNHNGETVTKVTCWYKDEDGDISKFSWVGNTVIEDLPKFFYRRYDRCESCNEIKDIAYYEETATCKSCGSNKFKTVAEKEMFLAEPVKLATGDMLMPGETIPHFCPTRYPFAIRVNVPKNFSFLGQSDIDIIRDQQDTIKKAVTKAEEKVIRSGSIVTAPEDCNVTITDQAYQIVKMTAAQKQVFGIENLVADITQEMMWIEDAYKKAQSMLGITDAYQGKEDDTAKSGVAKQIQVQQASGRLQTKQSNKFEAYKELFEIMFEFKLAFYDELRPYIAKDENGQDMAQNFDKYAFLMRDAEGKLFYNTDFIISADSSQGLPKDKIFMFNQAKEMLAAGAIDVGQFWMIMESINFPQAKQIRKQVEERQRQAQEMQIAQMQMQAAAANQPPSFDDQVGQLDGPTREMYNKLPPEMKAELMQKAKGV